MSDGALEAAPPTVTQGGSVGLRYHLISDSGLIRRNLVSKVSSGAEAAAQAPNTSNRSTNAGTHAGNRILRSTQASSNFYHGIVVQGRPGT